MGKKEPIKVSLSTFFLVIAIIVISVMGYVIYKLYTEKTLEEKQTSELKTKVSNLENTLENVQNIILDNSKIASTESKDIANNRINNTSSNLEKNQYDETTENLEKVHYLELIM